MALLKNLHGVVWQLVVMAAAGCGEAYTPVSEGACGWMSDRAVEIDVTWRDSVEVDCYEEPWLEQLPGTVDVPWQAEAQRLEDSGTPLFLPRARVSVGFEAVQQRGRSCRLPYRVRVESFATHGEIAAAGGQVAGYQAAPFQHLDPQALDERPPYADYLSDGIVSVGAIFGQMNTEALTVSDTGLWSLAQLEAYFALRGAPCRRSLGRPGRCEGVIDGVPVELLYVGPELFGLATPASYKRALITGLAQRSDVLYLNGHAFQSGLDALTDGSLAGSAARLFVLDICWASLTLLPELRRRSAGAPLDVVAAPTRIVTGSVASFEGLLDALLDGVRAPLYGLTWGELLREMNDGAAERAEARHDLVEPKLRPPEIYGVARLARPSQARRSCSCYGSHSASVLQVPAMRVQHPRGFPTGRPVDFLPPGGPDRGSSPPDGISRSN